MALRPIPDPGVLKEAEAFRQASQILNTSSESMMSVPTIVNAAGALELYLKSLNMEWQVQDPSTLDGKKAWLDSRTALKKGHAPSELYRARGEDMRNTLEQHYQARLHETKVQSLEEVLQEYDDLFQDWRYVFEGGRKSVNLSKLFSLLTFFSEALHGLPQHWA